MKVKDFKKWIYSETGFIKWAILWDYDTGKDIKDGCSVEYLYANYGDFEVIKIGAYQNKIVFSVRTK